MDLNLYTPYVVQAIIFIIALIKFYGDMQSKFRELEIRVQALERMETKNNETLEKIWSAISRIEIKLVDKKDRD